MLPFVHSLCPCRKVQIEKLVGLFGEKGEIAYPAIFVYGHTGTGKSHVLRSLMNNLKLMHIFVNCIECHSAKLVFESILEGLELLCSVDYNRKCDNFNEFLRHFKFFMQAEFSCETFYIIFEKSERLRNMDANLISGFMKLAELARMNVSVIFETEIALEKFFVGTGFNLPAEVHFDEYTQKELVKIMSLVCPVGYSTKFYASYCQLVISVFHPVCKDLNELKHLAMLNFSKYCEPLKKDGFADARQLWRNIEPQLKMCLSTVYLREVSSIKWEEMHQGNMEDYVKPKAILELPFLSKYLLIAAYLASHNPSRSDRRYFCKQTSGKMSRRAKTSIKTAASDGKLTGPKAFPLDRLMAIFFCIIEGNVKPNCSLISQISSLVSLNLMAKLSADDQIDISKYKCLVDFDFIKSIAQNVGFHLEQYLFEQ